jgi:fluoride ion exporter CrcB/FEX
LARGLTLKRLGSAVGLTAGYVSRLELDDAPVPPVPTLQRLAGALGVDEAVLLEASGLSLPVAVWLEYGADLQCPPDNWAIPANLASYSVLRRISLSMWLAAACATTGHPRDRLPLWDAGRLHPMARVATTTGALGAFTTYSAFNYATFRYLQDGAWALGLVNLAITVVGCLIAAALAWGTGRVLVGP